MHRSWLENDESRIAMSGNDAQADDFQLADECGEDQRAAGFLQNWLAGDYMHMRQFLISDIKSPLQRTAQAVVEC